jgi:hypothetical protein
MLASFRFSVMCAIVMRGDILLMSSAAARPLAAFISVFCYRPSAIA